MAGSGSRVQTVSRERGLGQPCSGRHVGPTGEREIRSRKDPVGTRLHHVVSSVCSWTAFRVPSPRTYTSDDRPSVLGPNVLRRCSNAQRTLPIARQHQHAAREIQIHMSHALARPRCSEPAVQDSLFAMRRALALCTIRPPPRRRLSGTAGWPLVSTRLTQTAGALPERREPRPTPRPAPSAAQSGGLAAALVSPGPSSRGRRWAVRAGARASGSSARRGWSSRASGNGVSARARDTEARSISLGRRTEVADESTSVRGARTGGRSAVPRAGHTT